jgi:pilus assembly protein Flp/PilA
MLKNLMKLWKDEEAPTAVEYGVMVALIIVVVIIAVTTLGRNVSNTFSSVASSVAG